VQWIGDFGRRKKTDFDKKKVKNRNVQGLSKVFEPLSFIFY
jgi:hypothetical protein